MRFNKCWISLYYSVSNMQSQMLISTRYSSLFRIHNNAQVWLAERTAQRRIPIYLTTDHSGRAAKRRHDIRRQGCDDSSRHNLPRCHVVDSHTVNRVHADRRPMLSSTSLPHLASRSLFIRRLCSLFFFSVYTRDQLQVVQLLRFIP